MDIKKLDI